MTHISRSALFGRLNPVTLAAIETATGFCRLRGNPYVELVHWMQVLVQDPGNDLSTLRTAFALDDAALARDLVVALDRLPRGATAVTDFAPAIEKAVEKGWLYASLMFGARQVRSGHLLLAMLRTPTLRSMLHGISAEFRKLSADRIAADFATLVSSSSEGEASAADPSVPVATGEVAAGEALARYAVDLTARARAGRIDRVVGRDAEIRQTIDILLRRRQNNPILTGEAGVGKTAIVEGLARRIVDGDVPPSLADVSLHALDIGLLQAGAGVKGDFEKRLRQVIDEVEGSPRPIVLFIDEAHMLIGAGGVAGTSDAANLLKPALARGTLRTIAATTWSEYRQYIEKDPALTRRFQPVAVGEPDTARAIAMLRSLVGLMEAHHGVVVLDEAVEAAVRLSQRYVPARQLPDKAVSLLDTAAARVAVSQHATPPAVEDARRRIELLEVELEVAGREARGRYAPDRSAPIAIALDGLRSELADLERHWASERAAVDAVAAARRALTGPSSPDSSAVLDDALRDAGSVRGDKPMVFGEVDAEIVAAVVGDWTGIPVGRMVKDEIAAVLALAERLKRRVVGQDHALEAIAKRVQTSRARLDDPGKPVGVFLLCGPSGVGKTETALALAELLYAGAESLITINMSEFQEAHTVSTLKGAPAGYVGFGQGGVLTEAVRRRPYSVLLLDEVEKAHPDVHEMFFQVFDKGYMEDAEGRYIDFRNTLILLTSNAGTDLISTLCEDEETAPMPDALAHALRPELLKIFPPALLGRLVVLPYLPLAEPVLRRIVRLQLDRVVHRVAENHAARLEYDDAVVDLIVSRCRELASGGRMIDAILTTSLLPDLSTAFLERQIGGRHLAAIHVGADPQGFTYDCAEVDAQGEPVDAP